MKTNEAKKELLRRYEYLYKNAAFILAPFVHEQTLEEFESSKHIYNNQTPLIYSITPGSEVMSMFEEFLLCDLDMRDTNLYKFVESKRENKAYLESVKNGIALVQKCNEKRTMFFMILDINKILCYVNDYINKQSGDLKNKRNKLRVMDEYYRVNSYKNDGRIYTSGSVYISEGRLTPHNGCSFILNTRKRKLSRDRKDIGIEKNSFITAITNAPTHSNYSIFTEKEKQDVYLKFHDELPYGTEVTCDYSSDDECYPEHTKPCHEKFILNAEEIFASEYHKFYELCPHCGFMVNIEPSLLPPLVREKIRNKCEQDIYLYRKQVLKSELQGLEKLSKDSQIKMIKEIH